MDKVHLLFSFLFISLSSIAGSNKLPIKIVKATSQSWSTDSSKKEGGIKYMLKIYISTERKVDFINFWIGRQNVPFDIDFFSLDIPKKIQYGDSLLLTYNRINGKENENADTKRLPINYKGAGLIELTVDGETRYFIVRRFVKLAPSISK